MWSLPQLYSTYSMAGDQKSVWSLQELHLCCTGYVWQETKRLCSLCYSYTYGRRPKECVVSDAASLMYSVRMAGDQKSVVSSTATLIAGDQKSVWSLLQLHLWQETKRVCGLCYSYTYGRRPKECVVSATASLMAGDQKSVWSGK